MEFSRQDYWSRSPFPPPEDFPDPEIKPTSSESPALAGGFFTTEPPEKPNMYVYKYNIYTYTYNMYIQNILRVYIF